MSNSDRLSVSSFITAIGKGLADNDSNYKVSSLSRLVRSLLLIFHRRQIQIIDMSIIADWIE